MHSPAACGRADGVIRGGVRRVLQLRAAPHRRARMTPTGLLDDLGRGAVRPAPDVVRPLRFRDTRIEMAHGAGGTASRRLLEGLIAPLLGLPQREPLADAAI